MSKQQQSLVPKIWVNYGLGRPHVFFTAILSYPKSFSLSPLQLRCYFFTISTEVILGLPISPFIPYNLNQIIISPVHQALSFAHDQTISNDSSSPYITIYVQEKE